MVVPTRSQNSSWHSLWDLRGTQAPQLRQSNNTFGGTLQVTGLPSKDTKQRFIQIAAERMGSSLSDADFDVHVLAKQPVSR